MASNTTALARKFRVDVTSDLTLSGGWLELKGIYSFKPTNNPNVVDTSAYDTDGWSSNEITFLDWAATASFWRRFPSGIYDPGQELVRERVGQFGDSARIGIRWYDRNGGPEAYQGVVIVGWERANDGVKDPDAATMTGNGDGVLSTIANPGTAAVAPVLLSATPSGAGTGALVQIAGSSFTGTTSPTGVKIGGTNATNYVINSDSLITATLPSGSAGSAPITVTNGVGTSNSLAYTRAA